MWQFPRFSGYYSGFCFSLIDSNIGCGDETGAEKPKMSENDDGRLERKKRKAMKRSVISRCMEVFLGVMNHPVASIFRKPVIHSASPDHSPIVETAMA